MSSESQQQTGNVNEHDEPNDAGFAGAATTPTPERGDDEGYGEEIAVPAGDLTGSLMGAIDEASGSDDDEDPERK
jgi:hypothetical protein